MWPGLSHTVVLCIVSAFVSDTAHANSVFRARRGSLRGDIDAAAFEAEVDNAVAEAVGCGGEVDDARLLEIEGALLHMWSASPKNAHERVERRQLRHLAYRYFMQRFSIIIRGFEPSRPLNASEWGTADILSQLVPAFVESTMESQRAATHGFDLRDAVRLVATLEQLVWDSESTLLEHVYHRQQRPTQGQLSRTALFRVLQEYMLKWICRDDIAEDPSPLLDDQEATEEALQGWGAIVSLIEGQMRALDFKRQRALVSGGAGGLLQQYSFRDAHDIVGGITQSFASFWESECTTMKDQLITMDSHGTGRVPLSKFYAVEFNENLTFDESEAYLRELGALDETSIWQGKQVIIPNYMQSASNCIIDAPHYRVCCVNHCEAILGEFEAGVGGPVGTSEEILRLVINATSDATLDGDDAPHLSSSLAGQLGQIASAHGGRVPLHGRLFAQWLHYVFPRECPFPHRVGAVSALAPVELGDRYISRVEDIARYVEAANVSDLSLSLGREELSWMSQWDLEEELIADYSLHLRTPWEGRWMAALAGAGVLAAAGLSSAASSMKAAKVVLLPCYQKSHFI